jgi:hypothetical protein
MEMDAVAHLRSALEALDGVSRAMVDPDPLAVWLVCERTEAPPEAVVRAVLAEHGHPAGAVPVEVAYLTAPEPRRRVRFVAARLTTPSMGRGRAEVELEWGGLAYRGDADGETGPAIALRLAAMATLRSLEAVLEGRLRFDLMGIKLVRAFDADVVVALLRAPGGEPLVGASLAVDEPYRAAALAVLNATNRVLGNYLTVGEPKE